MMKIRVILAVVTLFSLFSCRNNETEQHLILMDIENHLSGNTKEAVLRLDSIGFNNVTGQKNRALFALLYNETYDKANESLKNDSLINIAISFFSQNDSLRYSRSLYCLGLIEQSRGNINAAATDYIIARDVALSQNNFTTAAFASLKLGAILEGMMQKDEAIYNYKLASDFFNKADQIANRSLADIYIGKIYANYGQSDSSSFYYNRATNEILKSSSTANAVALNGSEIEALLSGARKSPLDHNTPKIQIYRTDSLPLPLDAIKQTNNLFVISQDQEKNGDYEKALESYRKYSQTNDSIQRAGNRSFVLELSNKYNDDRLKVKAQELEHKNSYYRMAIIIVILLSVIIISIILALIVRMKRRKEEVVEMMEQLKSHADQLTESKNTITEKLDQSIETERRLGEVIESRLNLLRQLISLSYTYGNSPTNVFISQFNKILNTSNLKEGAFADLSNTINLKYFGIVDYLRSEYSQLSDDDIDLCCLVCAGFSPQEIAAFYNMGNPRSIFVKRARLAKKMGLDCDLKQFLDGCVSKLSA